MELTLPDMTCGHCVATVQRVVHALDPKAQVVVDLASKRAQIDAILDEGKLRQALTDEGYPPAPAAA
ncbi:MAG: heavy-metal-associated domain-containing protein [Burkholderiales bacterium]